MEGITFRTIAPHERDIVLDLLGAWISREFFARYFQHDPTYRDDLCFVACDGDRIVSTLQVFTKHVRVNGTVLTVGGIGNVYTDPPYRQRGLAPALLQRAIAAMERSGFDVSLLFATRLELYGALGWRSHVRHLSFIEAGGGTQSGRYTLAPFEPSQDLTAVMTLYARQCDSMNGTTVRDRAYWNGQLQYAGNPDERFLLARDHSDVVAYARYTSLYGFDTIMEHAALPGRHDALADLFCQLHAAANPGTLCQLACEKGFDDILRERGLTVHTAEDGFWMWRVINPHQLGAKLAIAPEATAAADFFPRLFPAEQSVYWIADRF